MKVYVVTEAKMFQPEKYLTVKSSKKAAEKILRDKYLYMRQKDTMGNTYAHVSDNSETPILLFIHEEEV